MIGQFCRFFCVSQDDPRFNLINLAYDADGVELPDEPETDWSRDSFYPFLEDGYPRIQPKGSLEPKKYEGCFLNSIHPC